MSENGNGNAGGSLTRARLLKLLDEHQRAVTSIRHVLAMLDDTAVVVKASNGNGHGVLTGALAIERARRGRKGHPATSTPASASPAYHTTEAIVARRTRTKALLDVFGESGTTLTIDELRKAGVDGPSMVMVGILARYGYLKRKGDAFTRTPKVFETRV